MTQTEKLISKILIGKNVIYQDAESLLLKLGFEIKKSAVLIMSLERKDMRKLYQSK